MHFQEEPLTRLLGSARKRVSVSLCGWFVGFVCVCWLVGFFFTIESLLPFFFIALKCYFQQLLSYKYLLFFFSSFPPGEKGRGPIENSALSLSGEFKCGSNNRFLLLFFFKFPVVLLPRSALKENRKGSLECARLYSQSQKHTSVSAWGCCSTQTHTRAHTHTNVWSKHCSVLTGQVFQTREQSWEVGKVWKRCSVRRWNINPSPPGTAKAFKEML